MASSAQHFCEGFRSDIWCFVGSLVDQPRSGSDPFKMAWATDQCVTGRLLATNFPLAHPGCWKIRPHVQQSRWTIQKYSKTYLDHLDPPIIWINYNSSPTWKVGRHFGLLLTPGGCKGEQCPEKLGAFGMIPLTNHHVDWGLYKYIHNIP